MRELVRRRQYLMTTHADDEADAEGFDIFDIESAILTGEIVERQKDRDTAESKYVILGETIDGRSIAVVAKLGASGRTIYILTVYGNER